MSTSAASESVKSATKALFEPAKLALDRAPVLRGIFERFATSCNEIMRPLCVPPCTFMLNRMSAGSSWDLAEEYETGICAVFTAIEWDALVIIGLDRRFVFSVTETMFGGDGTEPAFDSDRPFSGVELRGVREFIEPAMQELQPLLSLIAPTTLRFERLEGRVDFYTMGVADAPAVMAQIVGQVQESGGQVFIIIPQAALMPFRRKLERERSPEPTHADPTWSEGLLQEISRADVELDAVLDGPLMSLSEVARLRPRQVIALPLGVEERLHLESMGSRVFNGRLGQSDGRFTVQITDRGDNGVPVTAQEA